MNKRNILLILDSENKYRQKKDQYESIDIKAFIKELNNLGYKVEIKDYFEIIQQIDSIKNHIIVYTSHQQLEYKKYIEDIMYVLKDYNIIIPHYESLLAHENKEFQELQRKQLKLDNLKSWIISDSLEIEKINIEYPIVIKRPYSCSSRGVYLAHNKSELINIIKQNFIKKDLEYYILNVKKIFKRMLKHNTTNWTISKINDYKYSKFILQQFIPNLDGDFKILIYGEKYFSLKRGLKKGDFKASGSGIHDFDYETPVEVLNFAKECFEKLNIPFAGFDIAIDNSKKCYLIEFQSIHIGPITLMHSHKYYTFEDNKWIKHNGKSILEVEYAKAIDWYIRNKLK